MQTSGEGFSSNVPVTGRKLAQTIKGKRNLRISRNGKTCGGLSNSLILAKIAINFSALSCKSPVLTIQQFAFILERSKKAESLPT